MLDNVLDGVSACLRCEGVWVSPATLDPAFVAPRWAEGKAWWRTPIDCPECAFEGVTRVLTPLVSRDVIVDHCPEHGAWLDRGELGRLMGTVSDEPEALRARLTAIAPDLEQLVARREKWRTDVEIRRKAAIDSRQALEEDQRRRAKQSESERVRLESESRAATADTQVLPAGGRLRQRTDPPPPKTPSEVAQRAAKRRQTIDTQLAPVAVSTEAAEQAAERRKEIVTQRSQAADDVGLLQGRLVALEDHLHRLEGQVEETRQHAVGVRHELETARTRLRALDEQLDGTT